MCAHPYPCGTGSRWLPRVTTGGGAVRTVRAMTTTPLHGCLRGGLRLVQLLLIAMILLLVVRGPFYGLVDSGPYDDAWGGPSRSGAWLVHAAVAVPIGAAAGGLLVAVERLRRRLARQDRGEPAAWWVRPAALTAVALAAVVVALWTQQL